MNEAISQERSSSRAVTARMGLALLALLAAVLLIGGTAATINPWTVNPSGTFSARGPELTAQIGNGTSCIARGEAITCGDLFRQAITGGTPQSSTVTLRNTGSLPITALQAWSSGCRQGARSVPFTGTADLCAATWLTIHDDLHNVCYFPTSAPGPCSFQAGATLAAFATSHGPGSPIDLSVEGLMGGMPFTFGIQLDPAAGNDHQGRWAEFSITWRAA